MQQQTNYNNNISQSQQLTVNPQMIKESSRKFEFERFSTRLKPFQKKTIQKLIDMEDFQHFTSENILNYKYGTFETMNGFGKTRMIAALCKITENDPYDLNLMLKTALTYCSSQIIKFGGQWNIRLEASYQNSTLILTEPSNINLWVKEMKEFKIKYKILSRKDKIQEISNKGYTVYIISTKCYKFFAENNILCVFKRFILDDSGYNKSKLLFDCVFTWTLASKLLLPKSYMSRYISSLSIEFDIEGDIDNYIYVGINEEEEKLLDNLLEIPQMYSLGEKRHVLTKDSFLNECLKDINNENQKESIISRVNDYSECSICYNECNNNFMISKCCFNICCNDCFVNHILSTTKNINCFKCMFCRTSLNKSSGTFKIGDNTDNEVVYNTLEEILNSDNVKDKYNKIMLISSQYIPPDSNILTLPPNLKDYKKFIKNTISNEKYIISVNIYDIIAKRIPCEICDDCDLLIDNSSDSNMDFPRFMLKISRNTEKKLAWIQIKNKI
jgi:hypothetical protein